MSESGSRSPIPPPPPPPTKYSHRAANALARFAQPFFSGSRPPSPQSHRVDGARPIRSKSLPGEPQTVTHRTGIPLAALDISPDRTHAVIAGKEILKTIRVSPDHSSEEFNIRNAVVSYASTHHDAGLSMPHKDQLNVKDVKWSHGNYDRIIATAVANGRIVVYDLQRPGLQLCRFQGHNRQVHRLAFNPHLASWLLSGSQDGTIRMWDLRSASANRGASTCGSKHVYQGNSDAIRDVRWSPSDGVVFATASDSGAIQMWDSRRTAAPLLRIAAHDRPCFAVDWHPDGKHIVSGGTDRQVKVWDFSSAERRQKPAFQIRTPQAVTNVRWRPPSWVADSPSSGEWQSFQIVTSYDKEDPRIHLWDLHRPHVPFREFDRYDTPSSDLLWHSKDLLWTVGEAGTFTQTDVRYAPAVVNRRPTCSVAWSPKGDFVAFAQKRPRRRPLGVNANEFLQIEEDRVSNVDKSLSQSPADDILDDVALASSLRHPQTKSTAPIRPSKSLGGTPPSAMDIIPVLPLDQALSRISTPGPSQLGTVGNIPGATHDASIFRFLARQYSPLMDELPRRQSPAEALNSLMETLDHNAQSADETSLTKLAQTWRIIKFAILQELQRRSREQPPGKGGLQGKSSKDGMLTDKSRTVDDNRQGKVKSRLFKGVMETEGPRSLIPEAESTSNMTTPLAQPLPDSPKESWSSTDSQIPSINEHAVDLDPLPPSILSSHNGWDMSDPGTPPIAPSQQGQSASSEGTHPSGAAMSDHLREPGLWDPDNDQRSAPRAIAGRADWRIRNDPEITREASEDDYEQKIEDKRAAIRDFKQAPKKLLTLDSPMESNRPPAPDRYHRHDSSESFPMFSASTDSSHPSKSIGASYSSSGRFPDSRVSDSGQVSSYSGVRPPAAAKRESNLEPAPEEPENDSDFDESFMESDRVHLERPSSPPILLTESTPIKFPDLEDNLQSSDNELHTAAPAYPAIAGIYEDISRVAIPLTPDTTDWKPWGIEAILKEAVRYYHSNSSSVDIQTAAHLLQKLHALFQDCEQILPYEESEMIFTIYNEYLIRHSMDLEAAELRLSCVPTYPAVYDYAQADTYINVFCYTCQRPYENPRRDNTRCYRCSTPQAPCSICMSIDPPAEWVAAQQLQSDLPEDTSPSSDAETLSHLSAQSSVPTEPVPTSELDPLDSFAIARPKGSALWTWCQGCGHGGHLACISTWLGDLSISEGGCATPGCLHDCGPGPRRDFNRQTLLAESKRRDSASRSAGVGLVKRDPWTKGESKAVEKVRGMLGAAGVSAVTGGNSASTTNSTTSQGAVSSGAMSPKKVRLVTPIEQGKRRGPSSRSTITSRE
ncbi:uncharacterized protein N7459_008762 [Penicillium hispanicum]|uniref:uncharacterized protein n=1 Tax=Penicillium hispanicum TaxID=1080232 RepID=UPI00253FDF64|nr:uncharacterized protein N7459_008762 [Penicillium hispanicum]KAJ5574335.1 hypothetical protein N7459_008762 [Penicillium hispanicum]